MLRKPNPRRVNAARRNEVCKRVLAAYDRCHLCGKPVDKTLKNPHPLAPQVDEIIPVSFGGSPYEFSNCRLAHRQCNIYRSNHSVEWAQARLQGVKKERAALLPVIASDF